MEEKILKGKKTGFPMLLLFLGLYAGAVLLTVFSAIEVDKDLQVFGHVTFLSALLLTIGIIWCVIGWIPFLSLIHI